MDTRAINSLIDAGDVILVEQQFSSAEIADSLCVENPIYLGTGSFGETWLADSRAIKIAHNSGYNAERLEREIVSLKRVSHKNVVKLHRAYTVTIADVSRVALEFEYISGGSLSVVLAKERPSADALRGLARGLLSGISALHEADLLHRDIKPDNIALRDGKFAEPVILDLGLVKLLDIESITHYPTHVGTPMYMAPEQLRGERAFRASDLWAVGAVLYEVATGRHPFLVKGKSVTLDEALNLVSKVPPMPPTMPSDIADLIRKLLSGRAYRRGTVDRALKIID